MRIDCYIDGGLHHASGIGAYAIICTEVTSICQKSMYMASQIVNGLTNNQIELIALNELLTVLNNDRFYNYEVNIYTDSMYVVNGFNKNTKENIQNIKDKRTIKLWKDARKRTKDLTKKRIDVNINWVRGHSGNIGNESVDKLVREAIQKERYRRKMREDYDKANN